ncbi:MAG: radical SAM protein [Holophagales bacterium]|jgi:pyruvate-formate lyase-activating enzyme|nr:radical SAM protein [Holophagales bacterium]
MAVINPKNFIFYGAGQHAKKNLGHWLARGLVPLCFSDSDEGLHHQKISPQKPSRTEFEVLPLKAALELCPDADVYVTINIEADPKVYNDIRNYIISHGVAPERVGPVPSEPTGRKCIFYGAGLYAYEFLERWVFAGIVPVCFADSNPQKHYTKMRISKDYVGGEFEVLPVQEALNRYPDAFLYITTDPESYDAAYDGLIAKGIPPEHIGAKPQHCLLVGHQFSLNGSSTINICYRLGPAEQIQVVGSIEEDVKNYYTYSERLRSDLNKGKLTSCSGCPELHPGPSDEELTIGSVSVSSGMPGATKCNFKCFFCCHGMNFEKKVHERSEELDNVLEILEYFAKNEEVRYLHYAAAEITISPYRIEILKLLKKMDCRIMISTNASSYLEELKELLEDKNKFLLVSLDSGTPETFIKMKGVDAFYKVIENLEKYASTGSVINLKYIVWEGINCNETDMDNFLAIAEKINATVEISWDIREKIPTFSDIQYWAVAYLARQCQLRNRPYIVSFDTVDYVDRLKKDGLYPTMVSHNLEWRFPKSSSNGEIKKNGRKG